MPKIKVEFLPFYESIKTLPKERKMELGLIMSSGKMNKYRMAFVLGQGASIKEQSWDRRRHHHRCCKSNVSWRHLKNCPKLLKNAPDNLSDLKDL